ncbi:EF-hand domain-containing protein [Marinobacter halodurans]|uniref:EF-hand domain-containing protein n=1 Tax=Marinobacter halodurans TaxID=2528979 RepID=UPI0013F17744|nr:EF-hand domain-containing protein [Marinobacter halodurans]
MTTLTLALSTCLLALPALGAGDATTGQPVRESNSHIWGLGMDRGALDQTTFEQLDVNNDGVLSGDELTPYGASAAGDDRSSKDNEPSSLLEQHDHNDDGVITREEFNGESEESSGEKQP